MKKSELQSMVNEAVRTYVTQYLSVILPLVVNEVIEYKTSELKESIIESAMKRKKKSSVIKESVDDEYPTLGGKTYSSKDITELLGLTEIAKLGASGRGESPARSTPIVLEKNSEHGAVPVSADDVPDFVKSALTRDYSSLVKKMSEKK